MRQAVICALDGVLADVLPLAHECVTGYLGCSEVEECSSMVETCRSFALSHGMPFEEGDVRGKLDVAFLASLGTLPVMEGAVSFFRNCKKAGLSFVVTTGEDEKLAGAVLSHAGIQADRIIFGKNIPEGRWPLFASMELGLDVSSCVAVVASKAQLLGAKADGFLTVSVTSRIDAMSASPADIVVTSLAAFPVFATETEMETVLASCQSPDGLVTYGANRIVPAPMLMAHSDLIRWMFREAKEARNHAYAPYSRFRVGAALCSAATGQVYTGCNVENSSYGATICAERNAVTHAVAEEGTLGISILVVVSDQTPPAPPCAVCLQVLSEFCRKETEIHMMSADGSSDVVLTFGDLLPHAFTLEHA